MINIEFVGEAYRGFMTVVGFGAIGLTALLVCAATGYALERMEDRKNGKR